MCEWEGHWCVNGRDTGVCVGGALVCRWGRSNLNAKLHHRFRVEYLRMAPYNKHTCTYIHTCTVYRLITQHGEVCACVHSWAHHFKHRTRLGVP